MTLKHQQDSGGAPRERADYTRQDMRRRTIVNQAISMQESSNTVSAIEYLKANDIEAVVIARVLLEPMQRSAESYH
ncbi:hypothetical protein [Massilia sp. TSP1-1-2]|uniref:hypothetical protein n=1 Tax=Massilia sp. TSP1-1-2 TaxID=2804649 RepID=UPI003CF7FACB